MEQPDYRNVLLMGRPGSGKGTQAKRLAETYGWEHFSTGDRFKILRDAEGHLGASVREAYDAGKLLPDWFATYLFESVVLELDPEKGLVSEGYPRSLGQAETFDSILSWLNRPYKVLDLAVSNELVTERMLLRAETEHRPDSATEEQIKARLATYEEHTAPVLNFFRDRGMLVTIDGSVSPEEVTEAIRKELFA